MPGTQEFRQEKRINQQYTTWIGGGDDSLIYGDSAICSAHQLSREVTFLCSSLWIQLVLASIFFLQENITAPSVCHRKKYEY